MRQRSFAVVLLAALAAGCVGSQAGGMGQGGPHAGPPTPVPQLDSVPFRARTIYRRMGMMVDSTRMPFVASLRFLKSTAPDSTLVVFGLSFANRVLNFRRDEREFVAAYHVEVTMRRDSTYTRTLSRDATIRVATAPETMRRDESVVFQQLLTVPPGHYTVTVVLRDLNSPAYARVDMQDTVPLFPFTALSVPLPLYEGAGRIRPDSLPRLVVNPRGMVHFGTDSLKVYVEGYGLPSGTRLAARILDADSVELWKDTLTLSGGAATGALIAAETAAGAEGKGASVGGAGAMGLVTGAESGAAAGAGARALMGAGAGAGVIGAADAGAAARAGTQGLVGDAGSAGGGGGAEGAGSAAAQGARGLVGAGAAVAGAPAATGEGLQAGAAVGAAMRGLLAPGDSLGAATGADSAHPAGVADSSGAPAGALAAGAGASPTGGAQAAGPGALRGALTAAGVAAGAGAMVGAEAVGTRRPGGGGGAGQLAGMPTGAGARGRGTPMPVGLMSGTFIIPPSVLPLGVQTFQVHAVGAAAQATAPFLVGFSDPWAVRTFPQMLSLLRFYSRTDLVAKLGAAPRAERAAAWREFYEGTDPTPESTRHDSLEAYFQRIELANRRFLEPAGPGWRTDRGEVFVSLGEPDQSYEVPGRNASGIRWEYTLLHLTLSFEDPEGTGQYHLTLQSRIDYERGLAQARGVQ